MYCIAAHVPAIKAPGLATSKMLDTIRPQKTKQCKYREPDKLGLAYTPPKEDIS
jgi:hypothetical protein